MNKKILVIILALILVIATCIIIGLRTKKTETQPEIKQEPTIEKPVTKIETKEEKIIQTEKKEVRIEEKSEPITKQKEPLKKTEEVKANAEEPQKIEPKNEEETKPQIIEIKDTYSSQNSGKVYYRSVWYNIQIKTTTGADGKTNTTESITTGVETIPQNTNETKTQEPQKKEIPANAIILR